MSTISVRRLFLGAAVVTIATYPAAQAGGMDAFYRGYYGYGGQDQVDREFERTQDANERQRQQYDRAQDQAARQQEQQQRRQEEAQRGYERRLDEDRHRQERYQDEFKRAQEEHNRQFEIRRNAPSLRY